MLNSKQDRSQKIYSVREGWVIDYPEFNTIADEQMHSFWAHDEPNVEDDIADLRINMSEAEKHGIIEVLKLFTHYEMRAGDDYWSNRIMRTFKRPEIQRMATMFSCVEMNSHAPFYNKINEVLYLDNEEFYSDWKGVEVLQERMKFIADVVKNEDDLLSIGAFTFIEGVVLYSSFSFIKHFQAQECGKDYIKNICRGVNLSVNDENAHAVGGALLFRTILKERELSDEDLEALYTYMQDLGRIAYEHEVQIIDRIFEKGEIKGITKQNMKDFVKHRVNVCLSELGIPPIYDKEELDGFIESWFYKNINSIQFSDFFTGSGSEYHIDWSETSFGSVWENE